MTKVVSTNNYLADAIAKIKDFQLKGCRDGITFELKERIDQVYKSHRVHLLLGTFKGASLLVYLWEKQKSGGAVPLNIPINKQFSTDYIEEAEIECGLSENEREAVKNIPVIYIFDHYVGPANLYMQHEINKKNSYQGHVINIVNPDEIDGTVEDNAHLWAPLDDHHQAEPFAVTKTVSELVTLYWV